MYSEQIFVALKFYLQNKEKYQTSIIRSSLKSSSHCKGYEVAEVAVILTKLNFQIIFENINKIFIEVCVCRKLEIFYQV